MSTRVTTLAVTRFFIAAAGAAEGLPGQSIQKAVDAAGPGDTIAVKAGTYKEHLRIARSGIELIAEKGVIVDVRRSFPTGWRKATEWDPKGRVWKTKLPFQKIAFDVTKGRCIITLGIHYGNVSGVSLACRWARLSIRKNWHCRTSDKMDRNGTACHAIAERRREAVPCGNDACARLLAWRRPCGLARVGRLQPRGRFPIAGTWAIRLSTTAKEMRGRGSPRYLSF